MTHDVGTAAALAPAGAAAAVIPQDIAGHSVIPQAISETGDTMHATNRGAGREPVSADVSRAVETVLRLRHGSAPAADVRAAALVLLDAADRDTPPPTLAKATVTPYGWRVVPSRVVEHPGEWPTVLRILSEHDDGVSLTEIARGLNRDGITTRNGTPWHRETVVRVVSRRPGGGRLREAV